MNKPRFYRVWHNFLTFACLLAALPLAAFTPMLSVQAQDFADTAFRSLWQRTDAPVTADLTSRSYVWGDAPFATTKERYDESPAHLRTVQYFDKGRMELTYPNINPDNAFYVSSGLLVRDLVGGLVQVGDNKVQIFDPAQIAVAGDPTALNLDAPKYADFLSDLVRPAGRNRTGDIITTTIQSGRLLGRLPTANIKADVKYAYYESHTNHNIASPFWSYFATKGLVFDSKGAVINNANLFDWQFLMGYPISEPYWTRVKVSGKVTQVLVQLFERRVLSYTPTNPAAFQVEMGNVGQHYYNWRYAPVAAVTQDTTVPTSVSGSISPQYGSFDTTFAFTATGFAPNEKMDFSITQPNNSILSIPDPLTANSKGQFSETFQGGDVVDFSSGDPGDPNQGLGVYAFNFKGQSSKHISTIYFRLVTLPPLTPTTLYSKDQSVPDSLNAQVNPKYGPRGTDFTAVLNPFNEKDLAFERVAIWVTSPEGAVQPVPDVTALDETPYGIAVDFGSPPRSGVWAITFQDKQNAQRHAIVYLRVTEAPPEASIGSAFSLISRPRTAGTGIFGSLSHFLPLNTNRVNQSGASENQD